MTPPLCTRLLSTLLAGSLAFCSFGSTAIAQDEPSGLNAVVSKLKIKLYGYVKADASYDQSATSSGNYARWLTAGGDGDGQFSMTARQTRLGLSIEGPASDDFRTAGKVEIDFYSGTSENSANPRIRHAFVNVDWVSQGLSILAGQTTDVVSPLVPSTINYTVAWWTGDIGFRRNQVRLTKGFDVSEDSRLLLQLAATRSISGEDAGRPGFQGRTALTFPALASKEATLGLSGLSAPEADHTDATGLALDLVLPLGERTTLKSEFYTGENLDAYLGGIGQGVNGGEEIDSSGFWANVTHVLDDKNKLNFGFASDSPDSGDLAAGGREANSRVWANIFHSLNSATVVGFEIAHSETEYKGDEDSDGLRVQGTLIITL
jgi:hypothetical protein